MRGPPHWRWHRDESAVKIGKGHDPWRAADHEGEVLESLATNTRDKAAAPTFLTKAPRRHGRAARLVTGGLRSCRAENSHPPFRRRERAMLRFRQVKSRQKFAAVHALGHNLFSRDRQLAARRLAAKARSASARDGGALV